MESGLLVLSCSLTYWSFLFYLEVRYNWLVLSLLLWACTLWTVLVVWYYPNIVPLWWFVAYSFWVVASSIGPFCFTCIKVRPNWLVSVVITRGMYVVDCPSRMILSQCCTFLMESGLHVLGCSLTYWSFLFHLVSRWDLIDWFLSLLPGACMLWTVLDVWYYPNFVPLW